MAKACSIARFTAEDACSGLADAALMARSPPDLDLVAPLERQRRPRHRNRQILRGRGARVRCAHQQFRGRVGQHPSGTACLRQYPWFRRRLSDHLAHLELRGAGRHGRGHAARLLVHAARAIGANWRMPEAIGRESARRTIARLGPRKLSTRRAPVLFVPEIGARPDRTFHRRDPRQQPVPAILVPAECRGPAGVSRGILDRRAAAHPEGHGQRAVRR